MNSFSCTGIDFRGRLKRTKILLFLTVALLIYGCKSSVKSIASENLSSQYSETSIKRDYYAIEKSGQDLVIYLLLDPIYLQNDDEGYQINTKYKVHYKIMGGYDSRSVAYSDSLYAHEMNFLEGKRGVTMRFQLEDKANIEGVLVIYFYNVAVKNAQLVDIPLSPKGNQFLFRYPIFDVENQPGYFSYLTTSDSFMIKGSSSSSRKVFASFYNHNFKAALPPMSASLRPQEAQFVPDTTYLINVNEMIVLKRAGLYLIQNDTLSNEGYGIRIFDSRFPKLTSARELIDPLLYITTSDEMNKFIRTKNLKKELDNFWIGMAGNKDFARTMIKKYYSRVQWSNQYFTTFKEGWKTDMGMIFIIFGNPETVKRGADYETWYYSKNSLAAGAQSFTFTYRPNLFSQRHYELIRAYEYDIYWYTAVEQWRKGLTAN